MAAAAEGGQERRRDRGKNHGGRHAKRPVESLSSAHCAAEVVVVLQAPGSLCSRRGNREKKKDNIFIIIHTQQTLGQVLDTSYYTVHFSFS
jgi:predicted kinase